ncbi:hypothetical protein [Parasitella parasitica]|uniref:Mitogen-activated protein kinase n=1 Tax=Parasitella parasitica TaxID=35722 RepID=A0A0B7NKP2_9FUNG|nr:hypothetical protein [Parasitella parasitica]
MGHHSLSCFNQTFEVSEEYEFVKEIGQGAYGSVCAAVNTRTGEKCAIKKVFRLLRYMVDELVLFIFTYVKVNKLFERLILTKRALRELKLLEHLNGHKNIIRLLDMDIADYSEFNEIYLYQELMEADLHQIIRSGQPLTDEHYQSFLYQACCGLKYIHSANVLHRDLKPCNLLVNTKCELKICDFGLARGYVDAKNGQGGDAGFMTEYVATRYYRAPEIMLNFRSYTKASKHRLTSEASSDLERYHFINYIQMQQRQRLICWKNCWRLTQCHEFSMEEMKQAIIDEVKMFKARKHSLKLDMRGLRRQNSITTPTSKKARYNPSSKVNEMGYADQLSPVDVDPHLERDLSGIS